MDKIIDIIVTPRSKRPGVELRKDGVLGVRVAEPPVDGKANAAVIKALSEHFSVPSREIQIISGMTSKRKKIRISFPVQ